LAWQNSKPCSVQALCLEMPKRMPGRTIVEPRRSNRPRPLLMEVQHTVVGDHLNAKLAEPTVEVLDRLIVRPGGSLGLVERPYLGQEGVLAIIDRAGNRKQPAHILQRVGPLRPARPANRTRAARFFFIDMTSEGMGAVSADRKLELKKRFVRGDASGIPAAPQLPADLGKLARPEGQDHRLAGVAFGGVVGMIRRLDPPSGEPALGELVLAGKEPADGRLPADVDRLHPSEWRYLVDPLSPAPSTAWAADRRAMGTRNGEHDT